ncbi:MAG: NAD(P)H-dependent oxidoreductase subunit E [Gammaproteobacteria bacterium]|nr:NAD(P)H-dependent oxidoreductase subunit E [Gammaproteobacteria bacterium]
MSFYQYHVFFCTNERQQGEQCCEQCNATAIRNYAKDRIKQLGLAGPGNVRINTAGCLDRCELGPVIVVYPEEVWYTYLDREDVDEIINEHLINGRVVRRLII